MKEKEDRRASEIITVWRLLKTLYELKQGVKTWYDALCQALSELGFTRTEADYGVFFKEIGIKIVILAVYVDDCMVTGSSTKLVDKLKAKMNKKYKLTDLGPAHWLLIILPTEPFSCPNTSVSSQ